MGDVTQPWWVTPVATLIAAVLGGTLPMLTALIIFERQGERERVNALAEKAEALHATLVEGTKRCTEMLLNFQPQAHQDKKWLVPMYQSYFDFTKDVVAVRMLTNDQAINNFGDELFVSLSKMNRSYRKFALLFMDSDWRTSETDEAEERLKECMAEVGSSHTDSVKISLDIVKRVSVLREEANRTMIQRLRELVHNS